MSSNYSATIICPKCFEKHNANELENRSEYSCWNSEEVYIECPKCECEFYVRCENMGFEATEDFDIRSFRKVHKIKYPTGISSIFIDHYLTRYVEDGVAKLVADENDRWEQNDMWAKAYLAATVIWNGIKGNHEQD